MAQLMVVEENADLIEACQAGEPDSFRALFEKHRNKVYSIALRYSGDPAVAQDIAQETFLKLFSAIHSFRGNAHFDSWLYRLVVNCCFDQKRKARRLMPLVDEVMSVLRSPGANALDNVMRDERSACLREAVASLKPEQRMIVVLRYTQGLSYDEIAEAMGCSPGTIGSRLNRIHRELERRLSRLPAMGSLRRA